MKLILAIMFAFNLQGCASYYEYKAQSEELEQQTKQQRYIFKQCRKICGRAGVKLCSAESAEIECHAKKRK